ncbi:recombinase family protein [uncultured Eubacterium sp.]|uniref:recombinase family protein n=1 Tax=uncultured Eubacterium sp. TaxID=165185 RepID=UPI002671FEFC|nr:recombinase family protein [uncultured Eubacterium sp.]
MYEGMKYDALYARQSIDKKDSISIESQLQICEYETKGNAFKTYKDKGYSGKDLNRPNFEKLLEDIKQGLIKRVIVYKLDRISRSILDFANLMQIFEQYNVEFVSTTEKFDTSTPVGRAMLNICIVFAQLERETIQERVSDAYHSRSRKGFYMGGKIPYGFKKVDTIIDGIKTSKFVADEEESSHLKLIYSMYADRKNSLNEVVRYLVANNIRPKRGRDWSSARLSEMLRNPIYVQSDLSVYEFFKSQGANIINDVSEFKGQGCYLYQGTVSKSRKQCDLTDKEIVLAPHQGFISSEIWLACRLRCLSNQQSATSGKGRNSWLVGKIKCGNCGYAIVVRKARTKWNRYGVCSNKEATGMCKGTGGSIYMDLLEDYVFKAIKEKLAEFKTLSDYSKKMINPKVQSNETKIIQMTEEINKLLEKVLNANDVLMDYINNKVKELDQQKRLLEQENIIMTNKSKEDNINIVQNHVENWEKTSFDDKTYVVDILIRVIHISNGKIEIDWNI